VRNGDHVVAGGCLFTRTPLALVRDGDQIRLDVPAAR